MKIRHLLYFCSLLVLCCQNAPEETKATPKLFTLLSSNDTGIDFNNIIKDDKDKNIFAYANFYGGAGVGVGDFNNDGLQDIFFAGNMVPDKLYLNKGNLVFEDVTIKAGHQKF